MKDVVEAVEIGTQDAVPALSIHCRERIIARNSSAQHHTPIGRTILQPCFECRASGGAIAHVKAKHLPSTAASANGVGCGGGPVLIAPEVDGYRIALHPEPQCDGSADSLAGSRYENWPS